MSTEEKLHQLKMNGYCVLEGIIPDDKIDEVRESVVAAQAAHHKKAEAELAKTRARGHRVGCSGRCKFERNHQRNPNLRPVLGR